MPREVQLIAHRVNEPHHDSPFGAALWEVARGRFLEELARC